MGLGQALQSSQSSRTIFCLLYNIFLHLSKKKKKCSLGHPLQEIAIQSIDIFQFLKWKVA